MSKEYTSLGLMSGTSGDGVDASIIKSDGDQKLKVIKNEYFEYDNEIFQQIHLLKERIIKSKDLQTHKKELRDLERKISLSHAKIIKIIQKETKIDLIGFHGQTIFHNASEKISIQLGDADLLSKLVNLDIVYNFRKNDLINGGQGAPLAPVFHKLIAKNYNLKPTIGILNIGGISNITVIDENYNLISKDLGPGNCLVDTWVRKNSKKKFDIDGSLASQGVVNEIILEQGHELYLNSSGKGKPSLDVNDFDVSFARGLTLEDGASTLTDFTAKIISSELIEINNLTKNKINKILICGGGRKNKTMVQKIKNYMSKDLNIELIDNYGIDGDFVESQAFAYIAIRSVLKLPITFPKTTGCDRELTGGEIIKIK